MSVPVSVAVAGICGYSGGYVRNLLELAKHKLVLFTNAIDPYPSSTLRICNSLLLRCLWMGILVLTLQIHLFADNFCSLFYLILPDHNLQQMVPYCPVQRRQVTTTGFDRTCPTLFLTNNEIDRHVRIEDNDLVVPLERRFHNPIIAHALQGTWQKTVKYAALNCLVRQTFETL